MKLPRKYIVEGQYFTKAELLDFSVEALDDAAIPGWRRKVYSFIRLFLDSDAGQISQPTSGTTGDPKEFILDRRSMIRSAHMTIDYFSLRKDDPILLCLPVDYIAGKMMVVRALAGGLDLVLAKPSGRPLQDLKKQVKFASMVPLQVHESLHNGDNLGVTDVLLIGGGDLHPSLQQQLASMENPAIYQSFAMTETYTHFALKHINGPSQETGFRPLPGVIITLDKRGCLEAEVRGITPGKVRTNDLAEILGNGTFRWLGRFDNVINSGGIKIIPELVEQQFREVTGKECLVIPEKDERLGEKLVLLVETDETDLDPDALTSTMRSRLPVYEIPRRILAVMQIPRNSSMKPDRIAARELIR